MSDEIDKARAWDVLCEAHRQLKVKNDLFKTENGRLTAERDALKADNERLRAALRLLEFNPSDPVAQTRARAALECRP